MYRTVGDVVRVIENYVNPGLAAVWDNSGLILGRMNAPVEKVLIALDATAAVVDEALRGRFNMIFTHHPLVFTPIRQINSESVLGEKLLKLIENRIALYSAHTSLDACEGGINDVLAEFMGLHNWRPFLIENNISGGKSAMGRIGEFDLPSTLAELTGKIRKLLADDNITFSGNPDALIRTAAVISGSGGKFFREAVREGCDVLITADSKYNDVVDALESGLWMIHCGHYASEAIVLNKLKNLIMSGLPEVEAAVSICCKSPFERVKLEEADGKD